MLFHPVELRFDEAVHVSDGEQQDDFVGGLHNGAARVVAVFFGAAFVVGVDWGGVRGI